VDNTVTVQMRSERPLTKGAQILVQAPVGFRFDADTATSSFPNSVKAQLMDASSIRFQLSQQDFLAPNTYFYVSTRVRNPDFTPVPNMWYMYLQTQYMEHIDLRKFFHGFVIAHKMLYCQVYPNTVPWDYGSWNDVSLLFVTKLPIFTEAAANLVPGKAEGEQGKWQLSLVAPMGFTFPTDGKYSKRCSNFRRWGGKDSYEQLPERELNSVSCIVKTSQSVMITVSTSLINETRYSFGLNVTAASRRSDVALQEPWKLTVLESGQILHLGESANPLLGAYYEAEWFYSGENTE